MPNQVEVELQPGESLQDALVRMAKGMPQSVPKPPKPKKEKPVTVSDPLSGASMEDAEIIAAALHVYQRPGESDALVRLNGTRYREDFGPSVLVFVHLHPVGLECTATCKERIAE